MSLMATEFLFCPALKRQRREDIAVSSVVYMQHVPVIPTLLFLAANLLHFFVNGGGSKRLLNTTKAEPNAGTEGCQGGKKEPPLVVAIAASAAGSKGNILMTKDVVHCTQLTILTISANKKGINWSNYSLVYR